MRSLATLLTIIASSAFAQGFCLDPSFADGGVFVLDVGGVDNVAWSAQGLDLQPDGRIVVGGTVVGAADGRLIAVRLSTSGALDLSFGDGGIVELVVGAPNAQLETIRVQPDGTLVLAGEADDPLLDGGDRSLVVVARLTATGALDSTFGGGVLLPRYLPHPEIVNGQVPLSMGRVLLGGQGRTRRGDYNLFTLALLRDGGLDTLYGDGGISEIDFGGGDEFGGAIAQDALGRVLLPATTYRGTQFDFGLARLSSNGTLDPSFGVAPLTGRLVADFFGRDDACTVILEQPDGRVLCGGSVTLGDGGSSVAILRTLANGQVDLTFGPGGHTLQEGARWTLRALAVLGDGTIIGGGAAPTDRPDTDLTVGFLDSTGVYLPDSGLFQLDIAGGDDGVRTLKVDAQGRVVVFGAASRGGQTDLLVARLSRCAAAPDAGTLDAGAVDAGTLDAGTPDAGIPDAGAPDAGTPDAGTLDAGTPDAGIPDAGTPDAGTPDAGTPDAGTPDAGTPDAGTPDAGTPDAGTPDAGTPDAGTPDAGTPDAGTPDAGTPDAGTPDAGTPDAGTRETTPVELRVGCGCSAGPSWSLLAACWLVAFGRSRVRRRSAA